MGRPVDSIRRRSSSKSSHAPSHTIVFKLRPPIRTSHTIPHPPQDRPTKLKMADADVTDPALAAELKKKRTFRTFSYRGIELDKLLDLSNEEFVDVVHARARRRFQRGLKRKPMGLIKKLRKAKKEAPPNEKPAVVKTHLRDMIIVPEMIGSVVGIYNGKVFNSVEIKPEMVGHYLAEFSCSYKPVKHGRPGIGATHSSRFIPLK
ncbi:ribosomal protein S19-domain-containing protein [Cytidiella melzeri]|nr:ribosomal protein S19-domain-containing protein [Cytidiella melzeri]